MTSTLDASARLEGIRVPANDLDIALAQTASHPGDIGANVAVACDHVRAAAAGGASLAVFPELSLTGYDLDLFDHDQVWLSEHDGRLDPLRQCAVEHDITVSVGAAVRAASGAKLLGSVVLGPGGDEHVHAKEFLHGRERDVFDPAPPGQALLVIAGWRLAFAVCFDVAVPEHAARAASLGADAYIASALYVEGEERRVDIHFASRAMDHRMYSVLANHAGTTSIGRSIGGSGVWTPTGERVAVAGSDECLSVIRLHAEALEPFRRSSRPATRTGTGDTVGA